MNLIIPHPSIEQSEQSFLTASAAAAAVGLTCLNTNGFSDDDYLITGQLGEEKTELRQIASVTNDTTLVIDALDFDHGRDSPITYLKFNQIRMYMGDWSARYSTGSIAISKSQSSDLSSTRSVITGTGTNWATITTSYALFVRGKWYDIYSVDSATQITLNSNYEDEDITGEAYALVEFTLQTTIDIQVDQENTIWDDTDGLEEDYYRSAYYNSTALLSAAYSYPVGGLEEKGYPENSRKALVEEILKQTDPNLKFVTKDMVGSFINDAQRDIRDKKEKWNFQWTETQITIVEDQTSYTLPDDFELPDKLLWEYDDGDTHTKKQIRVVSPSEYYKQAEDQDVTSTTAVEIATVVDNKLLIWPPQDLTDVDTDKFHFQYYRKIYDLRSDGDQTIIPNTTLLKWYGIANVWMMKGSRDKYLDFMSLYKAGRDNLKKIDKKYIAKPRAFTWNPDGVRRFYSE